MRLFLLPLLLMLGASSLAAPSESVAADRQGTSTTPSPMRLVSLAPHITDMLVALGAGAQVVGVVDDHESRGAHDKSLSGFPVVADAFAINEERLLSLRPDLVIVWNEGTPAARVARLERLGFRVHVLKTPRLEDIAGQVEHLGRLVGRADQGLRQAKVFRDKLLQMRMQYGSGPRVRYFYQVWRQPLYSLHGGHLLSQALALCGADNILPAGKIEAPLVTPEFVIHANPDVIFFGQDDAAASRTFWTRFPSMKAVRQRHLVAISDQRLARPGPQLLEAVEPLCRQLQSWRVSATQK